MLQANGTHLVYFDNVYAYGRIDAPMTESSPIQPSSRLNVNADLTMRLRAN